VPKVRNWENEYYDVLPSIEEDVTPSFPPWFFVVEDEEWAEEIYNNYRWAMAKGSTYCCDLLTHVMAGFGLVYQPYAYRRSSALVGQFWEDIFCVSHFAPSDRKDGVALLRDALKSETPIVICVPYHLARQLDRLGYTYKGNILQEFAGELVEKCVMVNQVLSERTIDMNGQKD
jgi:hypothetical protein